MKKFIPILVVIFFFGCKDDIDDTIVVTPTENLELEDFIYKVMNFAYYWQKDVPNLADNKFKDDKEYTAFLQSFDGPASLFEGLQYKGDKYSALIDDYEAFENNIKGVSLSNGMIFGLVRFSKDASDIFGYVQYVWPDSDASTKDIQRGEKLKYATQKPVKLLERIVKLYSNEGDVILDPTMGSGSTGVACKNLNREFIGIELTEKYFEVAKNRLA